MTSGIEDLALVLASLSAPRRDGAQVFYPASYVSVRACICLCTASVLLELALAKLFGRIQLHESALAGLGRSFVLRQFWFTNGHVHRRAMGGLCVLVI